MPPKDTTASTPKSTASKSAGEGVKRRASGSAEGSGSKAPPGSEASPERTTQPIPIRESRLGGRTPLSKPSGTNPSRPGSSDGPDLKVFSYSHLDANGVETAINPDSDETRREFRIIADAYHIAWQYFNTGETKTALRELGEDCKKDWTDPKNEKKYNGYVWPGDKDTLMGIYLYNFLKGLTETTPAIVKTDFGQKDGRHTHARTTMEKAYNEDLEKIVDTRKLFHIKISDLLVAHLLEAYENHDDDSRYQLLRLFTANIFLHELCHAWVSFLLGFISDKVGTPPKNVGPWDDADNLQIGESGSWMENRRNGGKIMIFPNLEDPGSKDRRSTLYIEVFRDKKVVGRVIPATVAKEFNKDPMVFDLKENLKALFKKPSTFPPEMEAWQAPKRRKTEHAVEVNTRERERRDSWHIKLEYNSKHIVKGVNKTHAGSR